MARSLMFLGTHSSAGKSLLTAAFCRILARRGVRVAPFKAQNMSNNAGVTPEGGEMGRSQIVQAEAARIVPHTDMNPVLLKPEGNRRSQIVLNGRAMGHIDAKNWMDIKQMLWDEVRAAYDRLAGRYDVILLEGAGSPAEINLKQGDIVNLRMARHASAPVLLVGDIDLGGVFAALAGTMLLLDEEEREQVKGFLINRFRGDPSLLGDGLAMLREKAFGVPTLGVIPFIPDLRIAEEDAVTLERPPASDVGAEGRGVDIAIIHLPRIANFDEFDVLSAEPGVSVRYVDSVRSLGSPDAAILPGTKATLSDLAWLRSRGLDRALSGVRSRGAAVVGICGGFQMLGTSLSDPEGIEGSPEEKAEGLGLLPLETGFSDEKSTHRITLKVGDDELDGYEIHCGTTRILPGAIPFGTVVARSGRPARDPDGARSADGMVWGTYLHDIFRNDAFRHRWLTGLGWTGDASDAQEAREAEYDRLADVVEAAADLAAVGRIAGIDLSMGNDGGRAGKRRRQTHREGEGPAC